MVDYLRPDDFRNALGAHIGENFKRSPWLQGVTDYFCRGEELLALARPLVEELGGDLSYLGRDGQRVAQGYFWLRKPAA